MTDFEQFKLDFVKWMYTLESTRIGEHTVCPYAKQARLRNQIQFVDARNELVLAPADNYEITIYWLGNNINTNNYEHTVNKLNTDNPAYVYFLSTPESGQFVKNFTNCIFEQDRTDLENKRTYLKDNTNYYSNWPEDYFKSITGA